MNDDSVFNAAVDFLANGTALPKSTTNKFLAACLREIHNEQVQTKKTLKDHHDRLNRIDAVLKISGLTTFGGGAIFVVLRLIGIL